jgi:hypothetical protein
MLSTLSDWETREGGRVESKGVRGETLVVDLG